MLLYALCREPGVFALSPFCELHPLSLSGTYQQRQEEHRPLLSVGYRLLVFPPSFHQAVSGEKKKLTQTAGGCSYKKKDGGE